MVRRAARETVPRTSASRCVSDPAAAPRAGHPRTGTARVWDVVSSVDAAYLVTASSDTQARLWDVNSGEAIRIYSGHQKACCACALNDTCTNA